MWFKCHGKWTCNGRNHFGRHHKQRWILENPGKQPPESNRKLKSKGRGKSGKTFLKGKQVKKRVAVMEDGSLLEYDSDDLEMYDEDEEDQEGQSAEQKETTEPTEPATAPETEPATAPGKVTAVQTSSVDATRSGATPAVEGRA